MIKQDTYISLNYETSDVSRILSAFSAIDESVQRDLLPEVRNHFFAKLIIKLASFCVLHGLKTPQKLLQDIFSNAGSKVFDVMNSFLETGGYKENVEVPRELQQEILHFSRIVDLENLDSHHGTKRIRNSLYLESYLKVFSELVTVMRSRLLQRSKVLDKPLAVGTKTYTKEVATGVFLNSFSKDLSNYIILVKSERRRDAKDLIYQFTCLLSYLTPLEAFYALFNYVIEKEFQRDISIFIAYNPSNSHDLVSLSWDNKARALHENYKNFCLNSLPEQIDIKQYNGNESELKISNNISLFIKKISITEVNVIVKNNETQETNKVNLVKLSDKNFDIAHFIKSAEEIFYNQLPDVNIASIESGHIHLDRNIDIDQQIGFEIGKLSFNVLSKRQSTPPVMCPMIDDDHVIIELKPKAYENYMTSIMPDIKYDLIPESSPIIRAIVVELYHRINTSNLKKFLKKIGDNLYICIDENTTCEVFEDVNGRYDSGCVIFEVALLIYRSNPKLFQDHFREKFKMPDIHRHIIDVWNSDHTHDQKYNELEEFKKLFAEHTNPVIRNEEIKAIIDYLFKDKSYEHLNVLEDYYEHQQNKVRRFVNILNLPIKLHSITFNAQTGRIAISN